MLKDELQADLAAAIKSGNRVVVDALRVALGRSRLLRRPRTAQA